MGYVYVDNGSQTSRFQLTSTAPEPRLRAGTGYVPLVMGSTTGPQLKCQMTPGGTLRAGVYTSTLTKSTKTEVGYSTVGNAGTRTTLSRSSQYDTTSSRQSQYYTYRAATRSSGYTTTTETVTSSANETRTWSGQDTGYILDGPVWSNQINADYTTYTAYVRSGSGGYTVVASETAADGHGASKWITWETDVHYFTSYYGNGFDFFYFSQTVSSKWSTSAPGEGYSWESNYWWWNDVRAYGGWLPDRLADKNFAGDLCYGNAPSWAADNASLSWSQQVDDYPWHTTWREQASNVYQDLGTSVVYSVRATYTSDVNYHGNRNTTTSASASRASDYQSGYYDYRSSPYNTTASRSSTYTQSSTQSRSSYYTSSYSEASSSSWSVQTSYTSTSSQETTTQMSSLTSGNGYRIVGGAIVVDQAGYSSYSTTSVTTSSYTSTSHGASSATTTTQRTSTYSRTSQASYSYGAQNSQVTFIKTVTYYNTTWMYL